MPTPATKFKVQMDCLGSWEDTEWGEFDTEAEANAEIDDLIEQTAKAVKLGHMQDGYDREEYRVVPA